MFQMSLRFFSQTSLEYAKKRSKEIVDSKIKETLKEHKEIKHVFINELREKSKADNLTKEEEEKQYKDFLQKVKRITGKGVNDYKN